jgi:hemerythrin superfamily protein
MSTKTSQHDAKNGSTEKSLDAIALLKADHAKAKKLFAQFDRSRDDAEKQELAYTICVELKVHMAIEEEVFYPAVRRAIDADDILDEALVEHATAKDLIEEIEAGPHADDMWDAKVKVLGEYIDHHIKEEHSDIFPKALKSSLDLQGIGDALQRRKQQLLSSNADVESAHNRREAEALET